MPWSDQVLSPLWFRSVILTPQILQDRPGLLNGHILKWHRREVLPEQLLTNRMLPGHSGGVHDEVHDKLPASTLSHFTQGRAYETTLQGVTRFTFGRKNSPPLLHHRRVDLAKLDPFGDGSDAMFQFEIGQTRVTFGGRFLRRCLAHCFLLPCSCACSAGPLPVPPPAPLFPLSPRACSTRSARRAASMRRCVLGRLLCCWGFLARCRRRRWLIICRRR